MARWKFMSYTAVILHRSIGSAGRHSNWGNITAARLRESGASDADEPSMRRTCARRESHGSLTDSATPVVDLGI